VVSSVSVTELDVTELDVTELDLRGTPCPLNFIRTKLALETLQPGECLQVILDAGEPEAMVSEGVARAGHSIERLPHADAAAVLLRIAVHPTQDQAGFGAL